MTVFNTNTTTFQNYVCSLYNFIFKTSNVFSYAYVQACILLVLILEMLVDLSPTIVVFECVDLSDISSEKIQGSIN